MEIEQIVIEALKGTKQVHDELGSGGEKLVAKNQFGETALKVDIEAEKAVLDTLKKHSVPIAVISEEHGTVYLVKNPLYIGILDGLDGSRLYKKMRGKSEYGTMFAIFENRSLLAYEDYIVGGVMQHATDKLFLVSRGKGSHVLEGDKQSPIQTSQQRKLVSDTRIYVDECCNVNKKFFSERLKGHDIKCLKCSALYYVDVASGAADLALECTRKGNLEIAVAYGLIKEAGGVMVTMDGRSIGRQNYYTFGQREHIPIITAATKDLADNVIRHLNKSA